LYTVATSGVNRLASQICHNRLFRKKLQRNILPMILTEVSSLAAHKNCVATIPGDKGPRPLGTQLHATKPNEILHFDFLYIGLSRDGKYQYLLLLKDDLSGYLWLVPCRTADSAATFDALMRWFAVFGVVLLWISDRGSHFNNEVVQRVQKELKAKHHFTTANCPCSNGTIEFACKQVIRAFRAVLSELKMYADE
jgi:transposase InsO family protein